MAIEIPRRKPYAVELRYLQMYEWRKCWHKFVDIAVAG